MAARERSGRRYIVANLAMSLDGKIDSAYGEGGGFSSRLDRDRVDELRSESDALVVGARTVRAEDPPLHVRDPARRHRRAAAGRSEQLVVVVVSRSGRLPSDARFLREPAAARLLAVPAQLDPETLAPLAPHLEAGRLELLRAGESLVDPRRVVSALARYDCQRILVEGGGELVASFLEADLLDELRITLCPTLIGGRQAPTPVGGEGWRLASRRRLRLSELERAGDELFLRYEVGRA
ncbi:MAG: dihydrofolate reductase family protein [Acidobacteriota bacterium]|nr:MAG: dihydrofolate reductase family protein [Acidobacteriota bacterium]